MEINYNSVSDLRAFLDKEGLGMRKKFGQNFLINGDHRLKLAEALGGEDSPDRRGGEVWEIGPGIGAMTRLLLDRGFRVRAFEIDPGFVRVLKILFRDDEGFALVEGDVMKTWPSAPAAPFLLGNLPYNIGAALLGDLIEGGRLFRRMVLTVQNEVALRMAARPGSSEYSSFSVLCSSVYTVRPLMLIRGASFYPRPNVDSRGLALELRGDIKADTYPPCFYPLVRRLFSSRRKMIKNKLRGFIAGGAGRDADELCAELLRSSGLKGDERAETLGVDDFLALAKNLENMRILNHSQNVNIRFDGNGFGKINVRG
ncbi:MAG: 16S rRNA (adenine(1518)-N(6)/adenine(1519)-N(6))-dimethyltransferase RsmA [Treponema sp.]|jgi:16S rRNA (adenine1518-N6/adenine1519-N6)-dimethyltransferase|nr:16S rRNA (adenine(1518)-N(6)/adenine(1519)-N(6))-dimethyltransferase RsmA [Treponema sp.]